MPVSRLIAMIRGRLRREEFIAGMGIHELPIVSALPARMYRVDVSQLKPEQVRWLIEYYGVMIPADECTISMK